MQRIINLTQLPLHDAVTETWVDHLEDYGLLILEVLLVEDSFPGCSDEWTVLICDVSAITATRYTSDAEHEIADFSQLEDAQILEVSVASHANGEKDLKIALETSEFASSSAGRDYVELSIRASTSLAYPKKRQDFARF